MGRGVVIETIRELAAGRLTSREGVAHLHGRSIRFHNSL